MFKNDWAFLNMNPSDHMKTVTWTFSPKGISSSFIPNCCQLLFVCINTYVCLCPGQWTVQRPSRGGAAGGSRPSWSSSEAVRRPGVPGPPGIEKGPTLRSVEHLQGWAFLLFSTNIHQSVEQSSCQYDVTLSPMRRTVVLWIWAIQIKFDWLIDWLTLTLLHLFRESLKMGLCTQESYFTI